MRGTLTSENECPKIHRKRLLPLNLGVSLHASLVVLGFLSISFWDFLDLGFFYTNYLFDSSPPTTIVAAQETAKPANPFAGKDNCTITINHTSLGVTCPGGSDGSIDITPLTGTAPYSYNWDNGNSSEDLSGLIAGTYTITVTDDNSCTAVAAIDISEPTAIQYSATVVDVSCNGGDDGALITNAMTSGGTAGYTYSWNDMTAEAYWPFEGSTDDISGNNHDATNLVGSALYSNDAQERDQSFDFDGSTKIGYNVNNDFMETGFTERTLALWIKPDALSGTQVLYEEGNSTHGIALQLNGNTVEGAARKFFVQRNAGTHTFPADGAWHHLALVYDQRELTLYLDGVPGSTITFITTGIPATGADGGLGGTFSSNAFGNNTNDFYEGLMDDVRYFNQALSSAQIADLILNDGNRSELVSGTYTVTITDAQACTEVISLTPGEPDALSANLVPTDLSCFGATDGSIDLSVSGGAPAYTYAWSGGAGTSQDPSGLTAGKYLVTITDDNGCTLVDSTTIVAPDALNLSSTSNEESCVGANDGSIDLTVAGGTAPFTYAWDMGVGTNEDISGLNADTYTVTVTDDNSCTATLAVVLGQLPALSISDSLNDVSCDGGADGSIFLTLSGGTSPYQVNWGNGWSNSTDTSGLIAGNYQITVEDAAGCNSVANFTLTQPSPISLSPVVTDVSCNGGTDGGVVTVNVSGGTPGYTFEWDDIAPEAHWTFEGTLDDISGNAHHSTGGNGIFYVSSDAQERNSSMYFDGATRVKYDEAQGGFMDDAFSERSIAMWIKPTVFSGKRTLFEEGNAFYGLTLRLQGSQLRAGVADAPFAQVLEGPNLPATDQWYHVALVYDNGIFSLYLDGVEVAMNNTGLGSIPSTESGGGLGGNFSSDALYDGLFVADGDHYYEGYMDDVRYYNLPLSVAQIVDESRNDGVRNELRGGSYTVTVHDANACIQTASITVNEPTALDLSIAGTGLSCEGADDGSATASVNGGTPPYSYLWQSGQTTANITSLTSGKYYLTVTDGNTCTIIDSVEIIEPAAISITLQITSDYAGQALSCVGSNDGEITPTVSGGSGSYNYLWTPGGQTTAQLPSIGAGTYTLLVTDANGCTNTEDITISDPPAISLSFNQLNPVSCNGEADADVEVTVSNGNGPFTYSWENGQTSAQLSDVVAGTYSLTVQDIFACTAIDSVTISEPDLLDVALNITSDFNSYALSCAGASDGALQANPNGGTSPFTYAWSVSGQTNQSISGLTAGTYAVTLTDARNCTATAQITLNDPPGLSLNLNSTDPTDCGVNDGTINASASGGTGVYEYRLSTGTWQSSGSFSGLAPGTYNIYTRSSGTCEVGPVARVISVPESPSFDNVTLINPSTGVSSDGAILVTASGTGVQLNYRLLDSGGSDLTGWQEGELFSNLSVGTYSIQVKYYNQNCIAELDVTLIAGGGIVGSITGLDFCSGEFNGNQFVEVYYIPGPEDQLLSAFQSIVPNSCGTSTTPNNPVSTYVSIGIVESGTILYYDHWETDGYETNLAFPTQSSTLIWGDNDPSNGMPPGYTTDILVAGQNIVLENDVQTSTLGSVLDFDGRDKIGSRGNIAITRLAWADDTETLLAGALEVYPTALWGTAYEMPVGENDNVNSMFEYTGAVIMAQENGTSISIDADGNGSFESGTTLAEGQSYLVNGGINYGGRINSSKPVQVHLLTGDRCANFESRFFTLKPTEQWSDSYFAPVSTLNDNSSSTSTSNHPTYIHLYNPNSGSITINWETNAGNQTPIVVGSEQTAQVEMPDGAGAHFYTSGAEPFYAIATIDSDPDDWENNSKHDWGYALLPESQLTSQITMVGFAPGTDPSNPGVCCNSYTWSLDYVSSEQAGEDAENAFDKDESTHWHSNYSANYPHEISIDLGVYNTFSGFRYTPRQDGGINGRIEDYEFYYWDDFSSSWSLISTGTFANNANSKDVYFSSAVTSYRVRLVALSEVNANQWASVGEIELLTTENSAPVWLTAGYPTGSSSTGSISICIDYNGDGGSNIDLNGVAYDLQQTINEFQRIKVYDPDGNQTGMRIWVCDGSDALLAGAWGQDPATASGASPAIDLGVGLPNGIPFASSKCVDLSKDYNNNDLFDECDEVIYSISIRNSGALPLELGSILVTDTLPSELSYIPNSTVIFQGVGILGLADDANPASPFPLDEAGYLLNSAIPPGDSAVIRFEASINSVSGAIFVSNQAQVRSGAQLLSPEVTFPVEEPVDPTIAAIPGDTLISCEAIIPAPPFTDTCMLEFFVPQNEMSIHYVDSEASSEPALLALDGNPNTFWHTEYGSSNPSHPHELQLDLGAEYPLTGFLYTPRQSGTNGRIANYEFYVSTDGVNWGSVLASGTWANDADQKEIAIAKTAARYVRLRALSEVNANAWASVAEFNVKYCATILAYAENNPGGTCNYDITRTWTITNYCGRTADQVQTITVRDTTAPQLGLIPSDITVDLSSIPPVPSISATDNCDLSPTVNLVADTTYSSCSFTIRRVWTAEDDCSNSIDATQLIFVDAPMTLSATVTSSYNGSPISCPDANDGAALATPSGGQLPITYLWSNGQTTAAVGGLVDGTYTVTATDNDGCTAMASVVLEDPDPILITLTITSNYNDSTISCYGANDGRLLATANGGTGTLSYEWNTGATTQNLDNIPEGTYTVTVTDQNNCTASRGITIYEPNPLEVDPLVVSDYNGNQISCTGASDGAAIANPSGGTEPYAYNWSTGLTTSGISGVDAGWYYVTITDANGCTANDSIPLIDPPALDITLNVTSDYNGADVSCNGASDGSLSLSASGGNPPYTYLWDNGATTANLTNIAAGLYSVTLTDENGCTIVDDIELTNPLLLTVGLTAESDFAGYNVSCNGATDGWAKVSASGGTGAYTYLWSNGMTTDSLYDVGAGTYTVEVRDENDCLATTSVTITEPPVLTIISIDLEDPTLCEASDGRIIVTPSGGIGSYEYRLGTGAWQTDSIFTNLSGGTYQVYVRNSTGTCELGPQSVTLTDPIPQACPIIPPTNPLVVCTSNVGVKFYTNARPDATGYTWTVPAGTNLLSGQGTDTIVVAMNNISPGNYQICVVTNSNCGDSAPCCFSFDAITCNEICDNGIDDDEDGLADCDDPDCEVIADIDLSDALVCIHENLTFSATDAGTGALYQWDFGSGANPGNALGLGPHNVDYSTCGTKNISLLVTLNGCTALADTTVLVQDLVKPVWDTPPSDLTVECDGTADPGNAIATWLAAHGNGSASDNCGAISYTYSLPALTPTCGNAGTAMVTFTASDECGNDSSSLAQVTIVDSTAPDILGTPADTLVECDSIPLVPAIGTDITATDVCDPTIAISYAEAVVYHDTPNWKNTGVCSLLSSQTDLQCNDQGTVTTTDDTYTFKLTVIGRNIGTSWNASVAGDNISGVYNQVYSFGPYPNSGAFSFIISDSADPTCQVSVALDPGACD